MIFIGFLLFFALCNVVTVRVLLKLHPKRRRLVIALAVLGNLMWVFLPMLAMRTSALFRVLRSVFGPPWFAWLSFAFVYACFIAVAWLVARRHLKTASRGFLWATLVAAVVGVYQALVPLRVERVPVAIASLPHSLEGMTIAVTGDLHVGMFTRPSRLRTIFTTAARLRPDVIVIAGDLVDDDPYFVPKLLDGARSVPPSIPILAVIGNHEVYGNADAVIARMRGGRIRLLVNEGVAVGDAWIAGVSDYAAQTAKLKPNLDAAIAKRPQGSLPIALAHQPKIFDDARRLLVPLSICAHTHGGQLGFRPLRWSLAGVFLPFHMGLYERGASQLYVNTGTGYWLLPWRLGMTPEITLIELRRR
jgi:predicted MPP superfamily phosphohydrolase